MQRKIKSHESKIRLPVAAGRFYPRKPEELRLQIDCLLHQARWSGGAAPKAIIAPHAAYPFSGSVAASAYAQLNCARDHIKRVILLGPSHYVPFQGVAATSAEAFATPLGLVPVDTAVMAMVLSLPQVRVVDRAHAYEHSLEVQLPFLQVILGDFTIVPLLTGEAGAEELGQVLERLWGGPETCFVISSDLSHNCDYQTAREVDETTARSIERLCLEKIGAEQACGRVSLLGLLTAAHHHHLDCRTVDLRNSGDTGGPRKRVVGYGAFAFVEN